MGRKNKNKQTKPAESTQGTETAGQSNIPEVGDSLTVEGSGLVDDWQGGALSHLAKAVEADAPALAPRQPQKFGIHEASVRFIDDPRYKESWNGAILKHAATHGVAERASEQEWLHVFRTYGLKVRS